MRRIGIFLASLTLAIVLSPASAGAQGPPADVTIMYEEEHCPSTSGGITFVATGGIEDSGDVSLTVVGPLAGPFGVTGSTVHVEALFTGEEDTFTLLWHVAFMATDDPKVFASVGAWRIIAGTGDYAGLKGQGQSRGICEFGFGGETDTLEGRVQY
jgi:hypothetical protein